MATGDPGTLTPRQQQTASARAALARKFAHPEERRAYYEDIGRKAAESRIVLSGAEATALRDAYRLLRHIAERGKLDAPPDRNESAAGGNPAAQEVR